MAHSHTRWHTMTVDAVRRVLGTNLESGLTHEEVRRRSALFFHGEVHEDADGGWWQRFTAEMHTPYFLFLVALSVGSVSLAHMHAPEIFPEVLLLVLLLCSFTAIGVYADDAVYRVLRAIRRREVRDAVVVREGKKETVPADRLVQGDIVALAEGCRVPADMRLISCHDLVVAKYHGTRLLRRESKQYSWVSQSGSGAPRYTNMVYEGTLVSAGNGVGVVVATVQRGAVDAGSLQKVRWSRLPEPYARMVWRAFTYLILGAVCVSFIASFRGMVALDALFLGLTLIIAGMPFMTGYMVPRVRSAGARALLTGGCFVTGEEVGEQLGKTTVVLTDKTGVLTRGEMELTGVWSLEGTRADRSDLFGDNRFLFSLGVLHSDTYVEEHEGTPPSLVVAGRPIERALALEGLRVGMPRESLLLEYPLLDRLPFTPERRYGATLHHDPHRATQRLVIVGAPETLLAAAETVHLSHSRERMTPRIREEFYATVARENEAEKRVLAVAYREVTWHSIPSDSSCILETRVVFGGLIVLNDPLREDVRTSVRDGIEMGVRTLLLTGDGPEGARAIARATGIMEEPNEPVLCGFEIEEWSDAELYTHLCHTHVIAYALPAHKARIVSIFAQNGEVVAMVGETASDIPAMRRAHIGIALERSDEVVKQVSALTLLADHLGTIMHAIRIGKRTSHHLVKSIVYTVSALFSGVVLVGGALIIGLPLPVLPVHLLLVALLSVFLLHAVHIDVARDGLKAPHAPSCPVSASPRARTRYVQGISLFSIGVGALLLIGYALLLRGAGTMPLEAVRTLMCLSMIVGAVVGVYGHHALCGVPLHGIRDVFGARVRATLGILAFLAVVMLWTPLRDALSLAPVSVGGVGFLVGFACIIFFLVAALRRCTTRLTRAR